MSEAIHIRVRQTERQRGTVQYVTVEGIRVGFRFRHSAREDRWYMWLVALDGSIIGGPRKLVGGLQLLSGLQHDDRVPPGELFLHHPDRAPATKANIDTEARLLYREASS